MNDSEKYRTRSMYVPAISKIDRDLQGLLQKGGSYYPLHEKWFECFLESRCNE